VSTSRITRTRDCYRHACCGDRPPNPSHENPQHKQALGVHGEHSIIHSNKDLDIASIIASIEDGHVSGWCEQQTPSATSRGGAKPPSQTAYHPCNLAPPDPTHALKRPVSAGSARSSHPRGNVGTACWGLLSPPSLRTSRGLLPPCPTKAGVCCPHPGPMANPAPCHPQTDRPHDDHFEPPPDDDHEPHHERHHEPTESNQDFFRSTRDRSRSRNQSRAVSTHDHCVDSAKYCVIPSARSTRTRYTNDALMMRMASSTLSPRHVRLWWSAHEIRQPSRVLHAILS